MTSKLKTDVLETVSGSGTIALTNQLSGMTSASVPLLDHTKMPVGSVVQQVSYRTGAVITSSVLIPYDNTIPQITEGVEGLAVSITPKSASNTLFIQVLMCANTTQNAGWGFTTALFEGTTANAIASNGTVSQPGYLAPLTVNHNVIAGTTNELTFRARSGGGHTSGITTINSMEGAKYGGTFASCITITEIKG